MTNARCKWSRLLAIGLALCALVVGGVVTARPVAAAGQSDLCPGCVQLSIPAFDLDVVARPGGQSVIDSWRGAAVYWRWTDTTPGQNGTVWLAGHRTTQGGVFRDIPRLAAGDTIDLTSTAGTFRYTVAQRWILPVSSWWNQVDPFDTSRPRLIVQTSHPDPSLRYMVEAFADPAPSPHEGDEASSPSACRNENTPPTAASAAPVPSRLIAHEPVRLLDTREGEGLPVCSDGVVTVRVAGRHGIPADATAVVASVTATRTVAGGYVTVWPAGTSRPVASTLNLTSPGQVRANLTMVALGATGALSLYTHSSAHLIVDVSGYFVATSSARGGRFVPVSPTRAVDTRFGRLTTSTDRSTSISLAGRSGLPPNGVSAAVVNITALRAESPGFLAIWPGGTPRPATSNLNLSSRTEVAAGLAVVRLGTDGTVDIATSSEMEFIVDVVGYFTDETADDSTNGLFVPLRPTRAIDTRAGSAHQSARADAGSKVTIDEWPAMPSNAPVAVAVNLTAAASLGPGFLSMSPGSSTTSTLNVADNDTRANAAVVAISADRQSDVSVEHTSTHVIVDVTGYFLGADG